MYGHRLNTLEYFIYIRNFSFISWQNIDRKQRAPGFYLNNFDYEDEREGEEGRDQEQRDGREKMGKHTGSLITGWNIGDITGNQ